VADINVERKGPSIWPWIIGLIVLALLIWALVEMFGADREPAPVVTPADTVIVDTPTTAPPPPMTVPADTPGGMGAPETTTPGTTAPSTGPG